MDRKANITGREAGGGGRATQHGAWEGASFSGHNFIKKRVVLSLHLKKWNGAATTHPYMFRCNVYIHTLVGEEHAGFPVLPMNTLGDFNDIWFLNKNTWLGRAPLLRRSENERERNRQSRSLA